jgi:hypothetical protein
LAQLPTIADHVELAGRRLENEGYAGVSHFVQEERVPRHLMNVSAAEHRLRHAGEIREFVDHPTEIADLADDRAGQPLESLAIAGNFLPEASLQSLGGELDGCERILDFVCDTAGNV